jgi:hypothetical protein
MGTITTLHVIAFFYFSHRVSRVFTQAFIICVFRFFLLIFSKIVFIMRYSSAEGGVLQHKC